MDLRDPRLRLLKRWDTLPDLEAVRVFAAVAELRSFRGAAAALGLPRSTVSHRVSTLEASLGMQLVQRTTRHVSLTDAGEALLARVAPALQMIGDAGRALLDARAEPRGLLRVTTTPSLGERVGRILLALLERYPRVQVELELTDRPVDLVAEGFDLAVRVGALADSTLIVRPVGAGQPGYFASRAYLAGRPPIKAPGDLAHHDCVVFSGSRRGPSWTFQVGGKAVSLRMHARLAVNSIPLAREAALAGLGVAWLPRDLVGPRELVPVLRDFWPKPSPLQLVYPAGRHLAPQLRAAIDLLMADLKPRT